VANLPIYLHLHSRKTCRRTSVNVYSFIALFNHFPSRTAVDFNGFTRTNRTEFVDFEVSLHANRFISCFSADDGGGALFTENARSVSLELCIFRDCRTERRGGSFLFSGHNINLTRVCITSCFARHEGHGFVIIPTRRSSLQNMEEISVVNCTRQISIMDSATVRLENCAIRLCQSNFSSNNPSRDAAAYSAMSVGEEHWSLTILNGMRARF
jgi:hypothetical protein